MLELIRLKVAYVGIFVLRVIKREQILLTCRLQPS